MVYGAVTRMAVAERRVEQGNLEPTGADGAAPEGDYDDPTAVLAGCVGEEPALRERRYSAGIRRISTSRKCEIRLRSTMAPHRCTGYEVFFRCLKTEDGYAEIVRWNGKIGDFTSLAKLSGPQYGVEDGDVVEASIAGNVIKGYINGVEMISAADDVFDRGSPGVGFNFFVADTNVDHGFKYFEVDTYSD